MLFRSCFPERAQDSEYIKLFTKTMVKEIEMVAYGEPQVVHFADGTDLAGWTMIQLIETSCITGHFLDHNGDLYLDVFSCKTFEEQIVIDLLKQMFSPGEMKFQVVMRDARK